MDKLVWAGTWISEGHSITFTINDNDTVTIREQYEAGGRVTTSHQIAETDTAIEYQERYIKLGYDKIS